ncbi:MAG: 50S ribosomal protein L18 [Patescibacteria group bacterium]|nr:50S ribosomal protein L18 [Patescibacteria group bacterium]
MSENKGKNIGREVRHRRVRAKVAGTKKCPRLSIFRSNRGMYAQLIDDEARMTLVSAHSREIAGGDLETGKNSKSAKKDIGFELGKLVAKKAAAKKIKQVVFDRGGYKYHGRVKALAEGAREGGLEF